MKNIRDMHAALPEKDKAMLAYAFEHSLSKYVSIPSTPFVLGVNLEHDKHLKIVQSAGVWSVAEYKGVSDGV